MCTGLEKIIENRENSLRILQRILREYSPFLKGFSWEWTKENIPWRILRKLILQARECSLRILWEFSGEFSREWKRIISCPYLNQWRKSHFPENGEWKRMDRILYFLGNYSLRMTENSQGIRENSQEIFSREYSPKKVRE